MIEMIQAQQKSSLVTCAGMEKSPRNFGQALRIARGCRLFQKSFGLCTELQLI